MSEYTIDSIESLSFKDGVRKRIQMYLGSDDTDGIYQGFKEIINNATDEALVGYGNKIEIEVNEEKNGVSVRDYGRGVPFGIRDNGENVLISIYTKAHTGGKFNHKSYTNSSGLNGIGASATCLSSEKFNITSYRNGTAASASFKKGENIKYDEKTTKEPNGTYIYFIPDKTVFKNMTDGFTYNKVCNEVKNITYLNKGIHFIVKNKITNEQQEFYSENGIEDFIKEKAKKSIMGSPITCSASDETDEIEVSFIWTAGKEAAYTFVNGLFVPENGSPVTGAKSAITSFFKKKINKDIDSDLFRRGLVYAINCKVANPSFANQTKSKINNPNLRILASKAFKKGLYEFATTDDFHSICDTITKIYKAEIAADKAREAVMNHQKEMSKLQKSKLAFIDKLKDAETLGENSVLLLVEGDSAASMIAKSRDYTKFGLLALRGKLINLLNNTEEDYLANEEIKLLQYAMGIELGKYNSDKLRYGRVGICVDADDDGNHIALLVMAALQKLCPQFIKENRLCWLRAPLFVETRGKEKIYYYDDSEKEAATITGEVLRMKGLGSLSPDEMKDAMFSEKQRLEPIQWTEDGIMILENLMGPNVNKRKDFVFNNIDFSKYGEI